MMRSDGESCGAGRPTECLGVAGRVRPDAFLDQPPRRFDRIEIVRIGRQKADRGAPGFDELLDPRRFVGRQIVEQDHIPAAQARRQLRFHPLEEDRPRHRPPAGAQGDPAADADGAHQREIVPAIDRPRLDVDLSARDPRMRSAHRDIHTRLVDGDQPLRIDGADRPLERRALPLNVGSVLFTRTRPFFLST